MDKNSEKYLERQLCAEVKKLGGIAYKFVSPQHRGVPDRMCILPTGIIVFVELKTKGKKPTKLQEICMKELRGLKQKCIVVDSYDSLQEAIECLQELADT